MRPYSFSYSGVRTTFSCFFLGPQPRAQTTDSSTMQRACLPPTDYKTTALPPSSSSRQHHARVAGARCAMASCLYRSLRSITRRHHHLLCRCCRIIRAHARAQTTDNNSLVACREHACPQLTRKLQPCRPAAATGNTMRV